MKKNPFTIFKKIPVWIFGISIGIIILVCILAPVIKYYQQFHTYDLSNDPTSWGVFGDYIGGVLNPIIALASLGVLGYLTYLVSVQTNEQSKSLFLLEKKMNAYEELTKHIREINMMIYKIEKSGIFSELYMKLSPEQSLPLILQDLKEMKVSASAFSEFYYTLFSFTVKHGHLFRYDFGGQEYINLVGETKKLGDNFDLILKLKLENKPVDSEIKTIPRSYLKLLTKIVNDIRSELEQN